MKVRELELLARKGVFPYDWFDGYDKLSEASLPPKEEFYSKLYDEDLTEEDYERAKSVWDTFRDEEFQELS